MIFVIIPNLLCCRFLTTCIIEYGSPMASTIVCIIIEWIYYWLNFLSYIVSYIANAAIHRSSYRVTIIQLSLCRGLYLNVAYLNSSVTSATVLHSSVYWWTVDGLRRCSISDMQRLHVLSSPSRVRVLHVSSRVRVLLGRTRVRVQQVSSPSPSPGVCGSSPNPSPKERTFLSSSIKASSTTP